MKARCAYAGAAPGQVAYAVADVSSCSNASSASTIIHFQTALEAADCAHVREVAAHCVYTLSAAMRSCVVVVVTVAC